MTQLKVISVQTINDRTGEAERFELITEYKEKCWIILDREKHNQTFCYLMDCLRDNVEVDRSKLFLELKKQMEKGKCQ